MYNRRASPLVGPLLPPLLVLLLLLLFVSLLLVGLAFVPPLPIFVTICFVELVVDDDDDDELDDSVTESTSLTPESAGDGGRGELAWLALFALPVDWPLFDATRLLLLQLPVVVTAAAVTVVEAPAIWPLLPGGVTEFRALDCAEASGDEDDDDKDDDDDDEIADEVLEVGEILQGGCGGVVWPFDDDNFVALAVVCCFAAELFEFCLFVWLAFVNDDSLLT